MENYENHMVIYNEKDYPQVFGDEDEEAEDRYAHDDYLEDKWDEERKYGR